MGYRKTMMAFAALSLVASHVHASGEQTVETFDSRAIGLEQFAIHNDTFMFDTNISGGAVVAATGGHPAHSGSNVYGGNSITLVTEDEDLFSWPGIGAWVSGTDPIWLQAYEYDESTGEDDALPPVSLSGIDVYLSIGSAEEPLFITKAVFSSASDFTIDDLTLGIEGIGAGVPEPASWMIMIGGLGMIGGVLRSRRQMMPSAA